MKNTCLHCGQPLPDNTALDGHERLAAWMSAADVSRMRFATMLGISDRAVRYILGGRPPSLPVALAIECITEGVVHRRMWRKQPQRVKGANGPVLAEAMDA